MIKSSKTDWSRLAQMDDKDIDTSDIPALDEAFFSAGRTASAGEAGSDYPPGF